MGQSSADLDLGILLPSATQVLGGKQGVNDRYTIQYISGLLDFISIRGGIAIYIDHGASGGPVSCSCQVERSYWGKGGVGVLMTGMC